MAGLCHNCGLPSDGGQRLQKVLPCGHVACVECIGRQRAPDGGRRCPVCHKIYKLDVEQLATYQTPEAHRVWCRVCDTVARAVCLAEHTVCGEAALRRETAVELAAERAPLCAALQALAEDVRRELRLLQDPEASAAVGLAALRAALAAARAHPLHGLAVQPAGLLHSALAALKAPPQDCDLTAQNAGPSSSTPLLACLAAAGPHGDKSSLHGDINASLHGDINASLHGDINASQHGDNTVSQHGDNNVSPSPPKEGGPAEVLPSVAGTAQDDETTEGQRSPAKGLRAVRAVRRFARIITKSAASQDAVRASFTGDGSSLDDADAPLELSALSDELLEQVLALVPAGESGELLLPLRLVCRRWAKLIKSSSTVWRRRTLRLSYDNYLNWEVHGAGALRCAPALACVKLHIPNPVDHPNVVTRPLQLLQLCQTKIYKLQLRLPVGQHADRVGSLALDALGDSLRELDLKLTFNSTCHPPGLLVGAVARLTGLTALKLSQEVRSRKTRPLLNWDLAGTTSLRRLTVGPNNSPCMVAALIEANKASLLEIDFGELEVLEGVTACSALRTVTVRLGSKVPQSLARLLQVATLETLMLCVEANAIHAVVNFIQGTRRDLKVHLAIGGFDILPLIRPDTMSAIRDCRIRRLELHGRIHVDPRAVERCLTQLPGLEELRLQDTHHHGTQWVTLLAAWAERGVLPAGLAALHVHGSDESDDGGAWVPALRALRPALRICTEEGDDCANPYCV